MEIFPYIKFFIAIVISGGLLLLIYFDIKWFRRYRREEIGYVLRNPRDEKKVKELNLAYCIREHHPVKIVTGDADIKIFNSDFYDAVKETLIFYQNKNGDLPVEIVCGPILIKNDKGISYVLEAAKDKMIKLYRSNIRQRRHFRVGKNSVYVEQPHGVLIENKERYITIYFNNKIENEYYFEKFNYVKSKSGIEFIDSKEKDVYKEFIILTKEEFLEKSKRIKEKEKDISDMTYDELREELMA